MLEDKINDHQKVERPKLVQKFNYPGIVKTDDGLCYGEIPLRMEISKAIKLRDMKISSEKKTEC